MFTCQFNDQLVKEKSHLQRTETKAEIGTALIRSLRVAQRFTLSDKIRLVATFDHYKRSTYITLTD